MTDSPDIVTRFAPSPSGHLHVGGARTALFCWAYARGRGGRFIVRIEDTDQKRSSDAAALGFLHDLRWMGVDWDEGPEHDGCGGGARGPYFQSQRLDLYRGEIDRLIAAGGAYRAFETPEELDAGRAAAQREKRAYRYDRAALKLAPDEVARRVAAGDRHVVRFRVPDGAEAIVADEVLGEIRVGAEEMDDFIIVKADGYPTYHFAVVVDDELMEVTHVIRGQEHLKNTARHVLLQDALGYRRPVYAHVSTICNPDRSKMSKRDKDRALRAAVVAAGLDAPPALPATGEPVVKSGEWSRWLADKDVQLDHDAANRLAGVLAITLPEINVDDFRRSGYLPEVLVNYLALLGWSPGGDVEKFDAAFLAKRFDLDRLIKSPAAFDRDKLLAFNLDAIQGLEPAAFRDRFREHCREFHPEFVERLAPEQLDLLADANQGRSKTLEDPIDSCRFFVIDDEAVTYPETKATRKALHGGEPCGYDHLESLIPVLEAVEPWSVETLEHALTGYAEAHAEGKLGKIAQPLRIAVSGGTISPAIYETLSILGRESVLTRIRRCLAERPGAAVK